MKKSIPYNTSRRSFFKKSVALAAIASTPGIVQKAAATRTDEALAHQLEQLPLQLEINGSRISVRVDARTTVLDLLREQLNLTGTKKGCDHGQCGACTIHINGERKLACLSLAVMQQGKKITTIEGLANGEALHPMQQAFIECDGFQCGYCTPGQIMSAVALVKEGHTGSTEEIKEFMSGNLCRCGSYNGIVQAIQKLAK